MACLDHVEPHVGAAAGNSHPGLPGIKASGIFPALTDHEASHTAIAVLEG
jgi:hypothetical protein